MLLRGKEGGIVFLGRLTEKTIGAERWTEQEGELDLSWKATTLAAKTIAPTSRIYDAPHAFLRQCEIQWRDQRHHSNPRFFNLAIASSAAAFSASFLLRPRPSP